MRRIGRRRPRVATVVVAAVLGLTATVAAATSVRGGPDEDVVRAEFADASPLIVGNMVKSSGVKIGEVTSISIRDGRALVAMALEPGTGLPLHADATASIRPVSLLGERYIDLDRGSPSAPVLPADQPIPVGQTRSSVDLQDVLDTLDQPTGTALAAMITTLGEGVDGQGRNIDGAIQALAPALERTDQLVAILNEQNTLLTSLIDRVDPVAGALATDGGANLDRLLESTDLLLRTTAANRSAMEASLQQLPATLSRARSTLAQVAGVAEATTPTLESIRPVTDDLTELSSELQHLSAAADPALASLEPVLAEARRLLDEAAPLVHALRPAGQDLGAVATSTRPVVEHLTEHLGGLLDFIRFWALTTNGHDGLSHYFRAFVVLTPNSLTGPIPGGGDLLEPLPQSIEVPDVPGLPDAPVLGRPESGNATGLSPEQEQGLVGQLLGGR
ncbi:MCE family protein [Pseudonocardia bannensis]|uniref:MCE family protein n=1 Tax=Pseudonocardia bannensis TaxID=630973 RepID=A0A848DFR6_9PSEU|nr:MCE family protein [Pseudonocardia bannensis]